MKCFDIFNCIFDGLNQSIWNPIKRRSNFFVAHQKIINLYPVIHLCISLNGLIAIRFDLIEYLSDNRLLFLYALNNRSLKRCYFFIFSQFFPFYGLKFHNYYINIFSTGTTNMDDAPTSLSSSKVSQNTVSLQTT